MCTLFLPAPPVVDTRTAPLPHPARASCVPTAGAAYLGSTSRRGASRRRRRTDGRDGTPAPGPGCSSRAPDPARARTFEKATPGP
ncbi:hypothetical protein CERSUDRAFT_101391 [Gelatoporia subvermispora B]|uniref:Uncharacterized protein n=1 Tax=Ceriporiopsis subvermispora (strain B) TaxID=914234 RepID=M2Q0U3_CERS8|nr:hypothetical protein CERSUDRAFT_101391 [Gelatoporia subvermispora B]